MIFYLTSKLKGLGTHVESKKKKKKVLCKSNKFRSDDVLHYIKIKRAASTFYIGCQNFRGHLLL